MKAVDIAVEDNRAAEARAEGEPADATGQGSRLMSDTEPPKWADVRQHCEDEISGCTICSRPSSRRPPPTSFAAKSGRFAA
jgi:hypothetical protein